MAYIQINGSDLTGSDGDTNRTYTLTPGSGKTVPISSLKIHANRSYLYVDTDFTFSENVITFLVNMDDADTIDLDWSVTGSDSLSGIYYTNAKNIVIAAGVGVLITDETVGTGNNVLTSFDLKNGNVITDTYSLYHGVADSNDLTDLTETTHYSLDLDSGRILLTTAGKTALGTDLLYAKYINSPKISDSFLNQFVPQINAEVDAVTGNYWGEVVSKTEYFDGRKSHTYPTTDEPYAKDWDEPDFLELKYKNIQTITSMEYLDKSGDVIQTVDSDDYNFDLTGTLTLLNGRFPNGTRNVKIVYTHGYDTTPVLITELASVIGGIMVYANITGGSYDDITRFAIGRKDISIGEVYVNVAEVVRQFRIREEAILNAVGKKNDLFVI